MALIWFENGQKKGVPWSEQVGLVKKSEVANPYQKQLQAVRSSEEEKVTLARQLMRGPVRTLNPTASLREAQEFLKIYRIRHIPIVNTGLNTLEGIVSDRDILRQLAAGEDSFFDWIGRATNRGSTMVMEFMTKKVLVAPPEEKIVNIARAMFIEKLGCMPIVESKEDGTENLVGIITRSDVLRLIMRTAPVDFWL